MRWLLEMSTLVHVLGKKTCKKFLIKFHTVYFNTFGDACIDVVVSDDLEIVGHSFPVKALDLRHWRELQNDSVWRQGWV